MPKPRARRSSTYLTRRRWTEEDARQALAAMNQSGLELTAFAIGEGLDPQRLTRWRHRLARTPAPAFEEILPGVTTPFDGSVAGRAQERFEIVLSSGRIVRVHESFDAGALRRLLAVLEGAPAC